MDASLRGPAAGATKSRRIKIQRGERDFSYRNFSLFARALWPIKTAANVASRTGVTERMAQFWLAGRFEPSNEAFKLIIDELYRRT